MKVQIMRHKLRHNGKYYIAGDVLDLPKKEAEELIAKSAGAIMEIGKAKNLTVEQLESENNAEKLKDSLSKANEEIKKLREKVARLEQENEDLAQGVEELEQELADLKANNVEDSDTEQSAEAADKLPAADLAKTVQQPAQGKKK